MSNERVTEELALNGLNATLTGVNSFGKIFSQGAVIGYPKITDALKAAGGKPSDESLSVINGAHNTSKAQPEFILTFNDDTSTIIVVECKKSVKAHESKSHDKPKDFAVDGVLYYAKYLKLHYNVIAIAVSGAKEGDLRVSTYLWNKNQEEPVLLPKGNNTLYPAVQYLRMLNGESVRRSYSLDEIRQTAISMNNALREIKITQNQKPIFIAGLLIALSDANFAKNYHKYTDISTLIREVQANIESVLLAGDIESEKITHINNEFKNIVSNEKIKSIPAGEFNSMSWYLERLDNKIKPMMENPESNIDALGEFYHEFIKYSSGDGKILGQVLTPHHLTEFICDLADIGVNDTVIDPCCGSGSFLVTALTKMFQKAKGNEYETVKKEALYGIEFDGGMYTLSIANMIVRQDGKSNIIHGDCFNKKHKEEIEHRLAKNKSPNHKSLSVGLMNPPYSQDDHTELEFVENLLSMLQTGGNCVVVVPMSAAIGTKFKDERRRLFEKHTLKAVFSMPDDMFYSHNASTNVCVMVWEAKKPHDSSKETFFGFYKDDGYVKRKKLGRVDVNGKWESIKNEWLELYRNNDVKPGLTARKSVKHSDEWLAEAYLETDYSNLTVDDFVKVIKDYALFSLSVGDDNA
jgi:type I restriction-modification system DNA methylase subunit